MTRQIINEANTLDEMRGYYSSDGFKPDSVLILKINQSRLGLGDLQNWIAYNGTMLQKLSKCEVKA